MRISFDHLHHHLPGARERLGIERAAQTAALRGEVDRGLRLIPAMKQHPLLQRRQRIDVLDLPRTAEGIDQTIERTLLDRDRREV